MNPASGPENPPAVLYKYRSVSDTSWQYTQALLERQELFMATRTMFNDPFECRSQLSYKCTKKELSIYADRVLRKTPLPASQRRVRVAEIVRTRHDALPRDFAAVVRQINDAMDQQVGLLCLSAKPDHLLMWSHYADSHAGICVGFDSEASDSPFRNARAVVYRSDFPVCRIFSEEPALIQEKATYTKADVWSYEEEWRFVNFRDGSCVKRFDPRFLKSVILGARIGKVHAAKVTDLTRSHYPHAELLKAVMKPNSYRLQLTAA